MIFRKIIISILFMLIFAGSIFGQGIQGIIEYIDLGFFPVGLRDQWLSIDLPYYKPEGITQIPSNRFRALVIHELTADGTEIIPKRPFGAAYEFDGIDIVNTAPEGSWHCLSMVWDWAGADFTNQTIRQGLFLSTNISNRPEQYYISYGIQNISLVYSIRFLIYNESYELIDVIESERMGVLWELEWHLPEEERRHWYQW